MTDPPRHDIPPPSPGLYTSTPSWRRRMDIAGALLMTAGALLIISAGFLANPELGLFAFGATLVAIGLWLGR